MRPLNVAWFHVRWADWIFVCARPKSWVCVLVQMIEINNRYDYSSLLSYVMQLELVSMQMKVCVNLSLWDREKESLQLQRKRFQIAVVKSVMICSHMYTNIYDKYMETLTICQLGIHKERHRKKIGHFELRYWARTLHNNNRKNDLYQTLFSIYLLINLIGRNSIA